MNNTNSQMKTCQFTNKNHQTESEKTQIICQNNLKLQVYDNTKLRMKDDK